MENKKTTQITKAELDQMIKEEYAKVKKVIQLRKERASLMEEIKSMNEVEHTGYSDKSHGHDAPYMENLPNKKFEKKGSHMLEDEEMGGLDSIDMDPEMDTEMDTMGEFESILRELGKKLDAKVGGEAEIDAETEEFDLDDITSDAPDEDSEAIELADDSAADETPVDDAPTEDAPEEITGEEDTDETSDEEEEPVDETTTTSAINEHKILNPDGNRLMNEEFKRMKALLG